MNCVEQCCSAHETSSPFPFCSFPLSFWHRLVSSFEPSLHTLTWSDYRRSLLRPGQTRRFCANERRNRISSLEAYKTTTIILDAFQATKPPNHIKRRKPTCARHYPYHQHQPHSAPHTSPFPHRPSLLRSSSLLSPAQQPNPPLPPQ